MKNSINWIFFQYNWNFFQSLYWIFGDLKALSFLYRKEFSKHLKILYNTPQGQVSPAKGAGVFYITHRGYFILHIGGKYYPRAAKPLREAALKGRHGGCVTQFYVTHPPARPVGLAFPGVARWQRPGGLYGQIIIFFDFIYCLI